MESISLGWLVFGLVLCIVVIASRRAWAFIQLKKDSHLVPVSTSNPRDLADYSTMIGLVGILGVVFFAVLIAVKLLFKG